MTINDRIKIVRKKEGLSQADFANAINLAGNSISRIENGSRNASERTLLDISVRFNINLEWLKTGNGEIYKESNDSIMMLLKAEYQFDDLDIQIIENYLELSPIERQVFKDYIKKIRST